MDIKDELVVQFREQRTKFVYYIVALCVTSIGFAVYRTVDKPLEIIQIPLALALASWGYSIFTGFRFITISISTISTNLAYLRVEDGTHPDVPKNQPDNIKQVVSTRLKNNVSSKMERTEKLLLRQQILFYCGIILFISWHILEMYKLTLIDQSALPSQ